MEKEDLKKHRHDSIMYRLPYYPNAQSKDTITHAMLHSIDKNISSEHEKSRKQILSLREEDKREFEEHFKLIYGNRNEVPLNEIMRNMDDNNRVYQNLISNTTQQFSENFTKTSAENILAIKSLKGDNYILPSGFEKDNFQHILSAFSQGALNEEQTHRVSEILDNMLNISTEELQKELKDKVWSEKASSYIINYGISATDISYAYSNVFNSPSFTLRRPDKKIKDFYYLNDAADKLNLVELKSALRKIAEAVKEFKNYQKSIVPNSVWTELANAGWLNAKKSNQIKSLIPNARKSGTIAETNFFLDDLLKQQNTSNTISRIIAKDIYGQKALLEKQNKLAEIANKLNQENVILSTEQLEILRESGIALNDVKNNTKRFTEIAEDTYRLNLDDYKLSESRNEILKRTYGLMEEQTRILNENSQMSHQSLMLQAEANNYLVDIDQTIHSLLSVTEQGFEYLNENLQALTEVCGYGFDNIATEIYNLSEATQQGLNLVSENLNQVNNNIVKLDGTIVQGFNNLISYLAVANSAIVSEIHEGTSLITDEIKQTNTILNLLLDATVNNLNTEAIQRLKQGNKAYQIGKYDDAVFSFTEGLVKDKTSWQLHYALAATYEATFDYDNALKHYNDAADYADEIDFKNSAVIKAARLMQQTGQLNEAKAKFKNVVKEKKHPALLFEFAALAAKNSDTNEAIAALEEAIKKDENLIKQIPLDNSFYQLPIVDLYTNLALNNTLKKYNNKVYLFLMLLDFKETEDALNYLKKSILVNIQKIQLSEHFWEHKSFAAIKPKVVKWLEKELKDEMVFSKTPYAAIWLFYRMQLPARIVEKALIIDLNNDIDYAKQDYGKVIIKIRNYDKDWKKIITYIKKELKSDYLWLTKYAE